MAFLGLTFAAYTTTALGTMLVADDLSSIEITGGICDELYVGDDTSMTHVSPIIEWDYDTLLHPLFNGNLLAGNVDFSIGSVSGIIIKKREIGTYKWLSLFKKSIITEEDFDFAFSDRTPLSKHKYQYAAIPIVNGAEGNYQITEVAVDFEGVFILDNTTSFYSELNLLPIDTTFNGSASVELLPIDARYPTIIYTNNACYESSQITCSWIKITCDEKILNTDGAPNYRQAFKLFANNKKDKIIKLHDGRGWLAKIITPINESADGHYDNVLTAFSFVEIGDINDNRDLYRGGFTNFLEVRR